MTPNDLIAAFETLADAPDGVKRLRELVLQLAVRGKLVAQQSGEESPHLALQRIERARVRLVKAGELRKPKPLPPVDFAQAPAEIPSTWAWARLDQLPLFPLTDGDWVESKDQDPGGPIRLTQLADVGVNEFRDRSDRFMNVATAQRLNCTYLQAGDVLIARLPSPIGRACIFPGLPQPAVTVVDVAVARFNDEVNPQYVVHALNSSLVRDQVEAYGKGATRFRVATGHLRQVYVPLPPLAEQHRIVARVDELMGLLDRLEAALAARDVVRRAARDAALAALRDAEDTDAVEAAWGRIAGQMDALFAEPEDVGPLRQTVLGLAVRGRLVPQDPKDEPARSVLKKLKSEADRLVQTKAIRRPAPLPAVGAADKVFIIPDAWEWARLQDVGDWGAGATPLRGDSRYFGGSVNWFKSGELPDGPMRAESEERITQAALAECSLRQNQPGDVLIAMYGATIGKLGILEVPGTTNQAVCACTCLSGFSNRYLFLVLLAWRAAFRASGEGGAQPNISKVKIVTTAIPVPPLAEQHRIVAKVDALMALCDALEARLTSACDLHGQFAAAAVHHLDV